MSNVLCCISACLEETKGDDVPQSLKDKADAVKNAGGVATLAKLVQELPELLTRNTEILDEADRMLREEKESDDKVWGTNSNFSVSSL